jgi:exonuclease SbcC
MPLESLRLRNFQKHGSRVVEFDKRITVLQGPTEAGKSAIVRALRWVAFNRPAGARFRKRGHSTVSAALAVDGKIVKRSRGRSNKYTLGGQTYRALQTGVPERIARLLNLGDVNFQGQFDAPFWLAASPGEVSRNLNAIVDLGVIDRALGEINSRLRKTKTRHEVNAELERAAKTERRRLAWVPEYLARLDKLGKLEDRASRERDKCRGLAALIADVEAAGQAARDARAGLDAGRRAVSAGDRWVAAATEAAGLRELISGLTDAARTRRAEFAAASVAKVQFDTRTKGRRCPVCQKPMT